MQASRSREICPSSQSISTGDRIARGKGTSAIVWHPRQRSVVCGWCDQDGTIYSSVRCDDGRMLESPPASFSHRSEAQLEFFGGRKALDGPIRLPRVILGVNGPHEVQYVPTRSFARAALLGSLLEHPAGVHLLLQTHRKMKFRYPHRAFP